MTESIDISPLRRSLLFVPGSEPRKLEKSLGTEADTLLLDLEDAVAISEKERARSIVAEFLESADSVRARLAVRVNPPSSPFFIEDIEAVLEAGAPCLMLPKSEDPLSLGEAITRIEEVAARADKPGGVQVLALVESARGIISLDRLPGASPRIETLCFGHADFCRDMGLVDADAATGVALHARCQLSIAARAAGLGAIDTVFLDIRDEAGFQRDTELGLRLGYSGRLCIHPAQVPIANAVYTPTSAEIELAKRILAARDEAEAAGRGVFAVDGKMVDAPILAAQADILERARRAGAIGL